MEQALEAKPLQSINQLLNKSVSELGRALPEHMSADRLIRLTLSVLKTTPKLYQCDPMSVLAAVFQCASLGLEPIAGQAWIIPYFIKGRQVAQFQVGAYGWVELFFRHQSSLSLHVECVHQEDLFNYDLGANTLTHRPPTLGTARGPVIGYWAGARLANGGFSFKVMSRDEAIEHGKRFSKCFDKKAGEFYPGTPWREHTDAMGQLVPLKRLVKMLPKSVEIQKALSFDGTVKTQLDGKMEEVPAIEDETIDATPSEEKTQDEARLFE